MRCISEQIKIRRGLGWNYDGAFTAGLTAVIIVALLALVYAVGYQHGESSVPQPNSGTAAVVEDGSVWRLILNRETQQGNEITVESSHVLMELDGDVLVFEELK